MFCKICNFEISEDSHFWAKHKIKQSHYYAKYEPKFDLLTGEFIPFKSYEQYQLCDFVNKNNLKKWLKQNKENGLEYLINKLKHYCEIKKLQCVPSQNELRTISHLPIIDTFHFFCGKTFDQFCAEIGLISKYNYTSKPIEKKSIKNIIIDTREQKPLKFSELSYSIEKLSVGDYAESQNSNVVIERKSGSDFRGTLSKEYERFKRELLRAKEENKYLVILVESSLGQTIYANQRFGQASPEFLARRLREIYRGFDNCQILFGGSRKESKRLVKKILSIGENIKNFDLQFWMDKGEL